MGLRGISKKRPCRGPFLVNAQEIVKFKLPRIFSGVSEGDLTGMTKRFYERFSMKVNAS